MVRGPTLPAFGLCALLVLTGCPRPASTTNADAEALADDEPTTDNEADRGPSARRAPKKKAKASRGPRIGDIPLDAFADQPVVTAAARIPKPSPMPPPAPTDAPAEPPTPGLTPARGEWDTLITADIITSEVKQIRLQMKDSLGSVSRYNGNYNKAIQVNASVLAILANITGQHSQAPTWKPDARYVRELASQMQASAKALGDASYAETQKTWEQLDGLLEGNKPATLPDAAERVPFSEVARRGPAMRRMEAAYEWLKTNVQTAEALKKNQERALHETSLLATMTHVIGTSGYDSSDDEEYQAFVQALQKNCKEAAEAVKSGEFGGFSDALSRANKTCNECHVQFKG